MNPRLNLLIVLLTLFAVATSPLDAQSRKQEDKAKSKREEAPSKPDQEKAPKQITRVYHIPHTFTLPLEENEKVAADPFRALKGAPIPDGVSSARLALLKGGVSLAPDDTVVYDKGEGTLTLTTSLSSHQAVEAYFTRRSDYAEKQMHILVEFIEVDHLDFSDWMLENGITGDGTPLRKEVQQWSRDGNATILESVMVTARSGQRAKVESIREVIYPTEYEAPEIPNTLTQAMGAENPMTGLVGAEYETRNVGLTLEVDPVLGIDGTTIDLNLAPELVQLDGWSAWPHDDVEPHLKGNMPTFYAMKTTTQVTTLAGRYAFLSTLRPLKSADEERSDALVLLFVRADIGSLTC